MKVRLVFPNRAAFAVLATIAGVSAAVACGATSAFASTARSASQSPSQGVNTKTKTITLGASGAKSGPYAIYGDELSGAQAYFDMINAAGGVKGWTIKYVTLDDQYNPSKAIVNVKQLVEQDKVFALANDDGTTQIRAVLPFVKQTGIPLVAPASGRDIFESFGFASNMFPVGPSFRDEGALLADFAIKKLGAKKLGMIYSEDAVGEPSVPGYQAAIKSAGAHSVATLGYPDSQTDFSAYAQRLKTAGAKAVVANASPAALVGVQKAAAAIGYHPKWVAIWFSATPTFHSSGGTNGTYFDTWLTPLGLNTAPVHQFIAALKKYEPSVAPSAVSQQGWVDGVVTVAGLRKLIQSGKALTWANYISALQSLRGYDAGMAHGITYTPKSHLGVTTEDIIQAHGSKFVVVKKNATLGS